MQLVFCIYIYSKHWLALALQLSVLVELLPLSGVPNGSRIVAVSVLPSNLVSTKPRLCIKALTSNTKEASLAPWALRGQCCFVRLHILEAISIGFRMTLQMEMEMEKDQLQIRNSLPFWLITSKICSTYFFSTPSIFVKLIIS